MVIAKVFNIGDAESLKAMRTLRAFRPLRAVSRWEGMRVRRFYCEGINKVLSINKILFAHDQILRKFIKCFGCLPLYDKSGRYTVYLNIVRFIYSVEYNT
jgi:hypothetical protein